MKTQQLNRALRRHRDIGKYFIGIFANNRLPSEISAGGRGGKPLALIANTDPSHKPGKHWVAYFFTDTTAYYFDSYGLPPSTTSLRKLLTKHRQRQLVFGRRIQGNGKVCGQYCMYFLLAMVYGYTFDCFGDDLNANDRLVRRLIAEHFVT